MSKGLMSENIIRGYAWWLLQTNLEWTTDNYPKGKVPLVPFSDDPSMRVNPKEAPYIVYIFTETDSRDDDRVTEGILTFNIISKHLTDISNASKVLKEAFNRRDETAKDLNVFSSQSGFFEDYFDGITFTTCKTSLVVPGSAEQEDEGPIVGTVTIKYCYKDHYADQPEAGGVQFRPAAGAFN